MDWVHRALLSSKVVLISILSDFGVFQQAASRRALVDHVEKGFKGRYSRAKIEASVLKSEQYNKIWSNTDVTLYKDHPQAIDILSSMTSSQDVLYISGHCAPGSNILKSDTGVKITSQKLVEFLIGKLGKGYTGSIKIYACYSAEREGQYSSFTEIFTQQMQKAGYGSCAFFGYTNYIGSWVTQEDGETPHRGSYFEYGDEYHKQYMQIGRASGVRKKL